MSGSQRVTVRTRGGGAEVFDAASWRLDEAGYLYVLPPMEAAVAAVTPAADAAVAVFAPGAWEYVRRAGGDEGAPAA